MRAVIVSGGTITDYSYIQKQLVEDDTIICADSGYNHAVKLGLTPKILVGDFDSIGQIPPNVAAIRYPAKKNQTDTEIAMDHARKMGFKDFLILAGTGSRMDHTLTNILLLKCCLDKGEHAELIDEHNRIMITSSTLHWQGHPGAIVSLVPLSDCLGVTTGNLEYPLYEATLSIGIGWGVSNIMTQNNAQVSIQSGIMLVIMAKD